MFSPARYATTLLVTLVLTAPLGAQQLTQAEQARVDSAAQAVLAGTGTPSASIAIVRGGRIVYEQAYGTGRIGPDVRATSAMRYAIGSNSKQFCATAILMLAEERKLSLDDHVSRWFPRLTRANEVTIRELLSMTAGYQDFWPQDYVMMVDPDMRKPVSADEVMRRWAMIPLDFEPGTQWQYSNTNYVIAAAIVERASGMHFMEFLRQRMLTPLHMASVADFDQGWMNAQDAQPLLRNGLGQLRAAPDGGPGWMWGAGELAMTAHDLALWDIGMIGHALLRPESYREQQADMRLANGLPTGYGLGVGVGRFNGHRLLSHGGAVSGYTSRNTVFPDDSAAIVVLTNIYPGGAGAPDQIAARIGGIILPPADTARASALEESRRIYSGLMRGTVDRALFTPNCNAYFDATALSDYAASLGPLGEPTDFTPTSYSLRGGMAIRTYRIRAGGTVMELTSMTMPDGKIEQYIVAQAG
ncbi:MAG TPA: serine hydrolase domain-containing protein [Steroidobacteraceae bacterium]|nr:serine hydrolase domain-containing protein [Steroidobacteraceae bacterium]